jgi:hypothetical protein
MPAAFLGRNELALLEYGLGPDGRILVIRPGAGKSENPIDFGDIKHSVLGEANSVWQLHCDCGREFRDLLRDTSAQINSHRVHLRLGRADENHPSSRANR